MSLGRVLIADDQVNILDALKLLLGGEGYEVATAASPAELDRRARAVGLRRRADRSQLHARHDVRTGRVRAARADEGDRSDAARARDDRLEQRLGRGRGDAARRARLHREAVGRRQARGGGADTARTAARAPAQPAAAGREHAPAAARPADVHRRSAGHEGRARDDRARGGVRRVGADHRRTRHRKRGRGEPAAPAVGAREPAARDDERRRALGRRRRVRALRSREGRLHRRADGSHRLFRAGRRRHAVPRRDRQHADPSAAEAAARAADRRGAEGRIVARHFRQRPRDLGDQRRSVGRRSPRDGSARICCTG